MTNHSKPRIVVSRCLGFEACRYNGQMAKNNFAALLEHYVEFVKVCPEADIGLGTPRKPVRLIQKGEEALQLVQPATDLDVSKPMLDYSKKHNSELKNIDGFLLKSRSPSCGPFRVKVYVDEGKGSASELGTGIYALAMQEGFPHAAMEDEGRMFDFQLREAFLMRVFALARLRELEEKPSVAAISGFHASHKMLLMCYHQEAMRKCGRIASNSDDFSLSELMDAYATQFRLTLAIQPSQKNIINALIHGYGWISEGLAPAEKTLFLESLEEYRDDRIALATLQMLLKSYVVRLSHDYLGSQYFLNPYPQALCKI